MKYLKLSFYLFFCKGVQEILRPFENIMLTNIFEDRRGETEGWRLRNFAVWSFNKYH